MVQQTAGPFALAVDARLSSGYRLWSRLAVGAFLAVGVVGIFAGIENNAPVSI